MKEIYLVMKDSTPECAYKSEDLAQYYIDGKKKLLDDRANRIAKLDMKMRLYQNSHHYYILKIKLGA